MTVAVVAAASAGGAASTGTDRPTATAHVLSGDGGPDRTPRTETVGHALAPLADVAPRPPDPRSETEEHRPRPPLTRRVTLAFTGDLLLHDDVTAAGLSGAAPAGGGSGFDAMLEPVAPVLQEADLAICHLEVPLSPDGSGLSGYPTFNAPPQLADAVARAGYDGCSTASNHSLDQGPAGVAGTLDVLDAAGLGHAGTARSAAEDGVPRLYRVEGVTVGHVSATYGLNGFVMPEDQPWLVDLLDPVTAVVGEAETARDAGADVVVVSMHWGAEYQTEPTTQQRDVAAQLLASQAVDLVVGHHAHVVQPVELLDGKAVLYGLGNFLSGQSGRFDPGTQDGVVAVATVEVRPTGATVTGVEVTPTWVEPGTFRVLAVDRELASGEVPAERTAALDASRDRTLARLGAAVTPRP